MRETEIEQEDILASEGKTLDWIMFCCSTIFLNSRAASTETEPTLDDKKRSSKSNGSGKKGLFRKSLSLEQTGGMGQDQVRIFTSAKNDHF